MSVSKIAARYAKPLLELALEQKKLDTVYQDILGFRKALENRDLFLLFKSPIVNPSKKLAIVTELFQKRMDSTTFSFLKIIIKKGREKLLDDITKNFIEQYKEHNNIQTVHLTTARQFTDAELDEIKKKLQFAYLKDMTIELETSIDPEIIGGFIINIDDKEYDASVEHKLDVMRKSFTGNQYQKAI